MYAARTFILSSLHQPENYISSSASMPKRMKYTMAVMAYQAVQ